MCPHPQYKQHEKGNMSYELFTKIIDQIAPYAEIIKLHWVGEPLVNKNIVKMIRYARAKTSAKLFMSTNASLLSGQLAVDIRKSGLDKIIFSLDGDSKETFERIRIHGNFDQVTNNITNFIEAVARDGGPICEVKMIQFDTNASEMSQFREKWDQYDCTIVHVMWLSSWAGQLSELENMSSFTSPYATRERQSCADLWFKMQIDWTGKVALCCFDWSGEVILGDVNLQPIFSIWQGDVIKRERERHIASDYIGICRNCKEWARVDEYDFWYEYSNLKSDPSMIWYSNKIENEYIDTSSVDVNAPKASENTEMNEED